MNRVLKLEFRNLRLVVYEFFVIFRDFELVVYARIVVFYVFGLGVGV